MEVCHYHSSKPAIDQCCDCHKNICSSCLVRVEGMPYCDVCWERHLAPLKQAAEDGKTDVLVPWSQWQDLGILTAFWQTFKQIALNPNAFFSKVPTKSDFATPLFFAAICTLLFWFPPNLVYLQYLLPMWQEFAAQLGEDGKSSLMANMNTSVSGFQVVMMPLNYLFIEIILVAWIQQFLVMMFQGKAGFPATFQIRCYAMAVQVLNFIPLLGILLAQVGSILICMRGFHIVQRIPVGQAFVVAIAPAMLSMILVIVASAL